MRSRWDEGPFRVPEFKSKKAEKGQNNTISLGWRTGRQKYITLIPFGCPPTPAPSVRLGFSDVSLPVPAGRDCSGAYCEIEREFASDLLSPGFYREESKDWGSTAAECIQ